MPNCGNLRMRAIVMYFSKILYSGKILKAEKSMKIAILNKSSIGKRFLTLKLAKNHQKTQNSFDYKFGFEKIHFHRANGTKVYTDSDLWKRESLHFIIYDNFGVKMKLTMNPSDPCNRVGIKIESATNGNLIFMRKTPRAPAAEVSNISAVNGRTQGYLAGNRRTNVKKTLKLTGNGRDGGRTYKFISWQ